jgi:hypothetical protein
MRRLALLLLAIAVSSACGEDERLEPLRAPDAGGSLGGTLDACQAFGAFLSVPGVPERLCALNRREGADALEQCRSCAAAATFTDGLVTTLSCPAEIDRCPVDDTSLRQCFQDVGQLMTEAIPGCDAAATGRLEPADVGLRLVASRCGPVLVDCPPLQDLVLALLGAAL